MTLDRLRILVDASPIGQLLLDREGHVHLVNPAASVMLGWSTSLSLPVEPAFADPVFAATFAELSRRAWAGEPQRSVEVTTPTPAPQTTAGANAQFLLNDFHRSETKNGQKIWEVKASRGQYFPDKQMAEVFEADVWVFRDKGEQVFLKAPEATLGFEASALTKAFFPKSVHVVYNDKVTLDTSAATYDKSSNSVFSDTTVTIVSDMMDLTGARFTARAGW